MDEQNLPYTHTHKAASSQAHIHTYYSFILQPSFTDVILTKLPAASLIEKEKGERKKEEMLTNNFHSHPRHHELHKSHVLSHKGKPFALCPLKKKKKGCSVFKWNNV